MGQVFMAGNRYKNLKIPVLGSRCKIVADLLSDYVYQNLESVRILQASPFFPQLCPVAAVHIVVWAHLGQSL